jgi:energy-coupling factor transporter ATP-binding protein EcfA2
VLRPVGPYPILVLNGEQSSGKSTLARILRLLIDPHTCPVLALPSSTENLMATALNGWLLAYENISTIPNWLSDCICQLAFGGGFAGRTLFTNDERTDIYAQRPVILIGIDDFVLRGDLRDRSVFLHLPAISETRRQTERKFWPAFRADYPRILGGVLDAIVGGLRELPSVNLTDLPRMADYAEWGEATSRGLGWGADTFMAKGHALRGDQRPKGPAKRVCSAGRNEHAMRE